MPELGYFSKFPSQHYQQSQHHPHEEIVSILSSQALDTNKAAQYP
ncbi:MAG: hypothetical protein WBP46_08810 [Thiolinea sp.]